MHDTASQTIPAHRGLPPGLAWSGDGKVVPTTEFAHDEFGEVLEVVRQWPLADRLQLAESLGLPIGCDSQARREGAVPGLWTQTYGVPPRGHARTPQA